MRCSSVRKRGRYTAWARRSCKRPPESSAEARSNIVWNLLKKRYNNARINYLNHISVYSRLCFGCTEVCSSQIRIDARVKKQVTNCIMNLVWICPVLLICFMTVHPARRTSYYGRVHNTLKNCSTLPMWRSCLPGELETNCPGLSKTISNPLRRSHQLVG